MPTQADLRALIEKIESCKDRNERAELYRQYDMMEEEMRNNESLSR